MSATGADLLGQLLIIGFTENRWKSAAERLLRDISPGGVLFSAQNLRTPEFTAELLQQVASTLAVPAFLALAEEGGTVDPLQVFFPPLPSPRAAAEKSLSAVERLGELTGAGLKLLGFNTNFAPVLDLASPFCEPILGTRTFGQDAGKVARSGKAFLHGLRQSMILACGKHFPGTGSAKLDARSRLPVVGKTMAELWSQDLVPYRELLRHLPLVMVSHAAYKAYDYDLPRPATLSMKVLEGLLRTKLGYQGVAVADDLAGEAVRGTLDPGEAAVRSVNAGCDLLLVGPSGASTEAVLAGLKRGLESGKLPERRVEQALERIRTAKKALPLPRGKPSKGAVDQLARQFEKFGKEFAPREQKIA